MAFRKNIITIQPFHEPNMHVVIAIVHHFILWCEFASTFNVLTYMAATSHVAGFLRRVSDTLGLRFLHSTLPLVLMGIHNLVTSAIWIEVIVFTLLYTCDLPLL